jgi:hypothetical protein
MISQVRAATLGITLPEDTAKLELLEREKRADLAATLSPEELADYDLRSSTVTSRLRQALTLMDATEQEFRTLFAIHQASADQLYPTAATMRPDTIEQRRETLARVDAQVKAALGEARAAEFKRAADNEFQQLAGLATREKLPLSAAVQAYTIRTATTEESVRIVQDAQMTAEAKRAAMQALAQNARAQLATALGASGQGYGQSAQWLKSIESGMSVRFEGNTTYFTPIGTPRPAKQ